MWIKLNTSVAGANFSHKAGDKVNWPNEAEAKRYITSGQAVACRPPADADETPLPAGGKGERTTLNRGETAGGAGGSGRQPAQPPAPAGQEDRDAADDAEEGKFLGRDENQSDADRDAGAGGVGGTTTPSTAPRPNPTTSKGGGTGSGAGGGGKGKRG